LSRRAWLLERRGTRRLLEQNPDLTIWRCINGRILLVHRRLLKRRSRLEHGLLRELHVRRRPRLPRRRLKRLQRTRGSRSERPGKRRYHPPGLTTTQSR
jgi:hypothetical protein